jgi:hypothetical protein
MLCARQYTGASDCSACRSFRQALFSFRHTSVFAPVTSEQPKSWGASRPGAAPTVAGTVDGSPQGLPGGGILALSAGFFAACELWCGALVFTLASPMLDNVHESLLDVDMPASGGRWLSSVGQDFSLM